jgi:uncharacterized protein (TIGR02231 family)
MIRCAVVLAIAVLANTVTGQERPPTIEPTVHQVDASIDAVTVYRNRAAITRRARLELSAGVHELVFDHLPASVDPGSLQARTTAGARVLGVDFEQRAVAASEAPQLTQLNTQIAAVRDRIAAVDRQMELIGIQEAFLDALTIRVQDDSQARAGTAALDLDAIRKQYAFLTDERATLLERRGELDATRTELDTQLALLEQQRDSMGGDALVRRSATISVVVAEPGTFEFRLAYLVRDATWAPTYNIRAAVDGSAVEVEYEALITQRTGEDWRDVQLALSTAQPTIAANPPVLNPWFVDVLTAREADRIPARSLSSSDVLPPPPPTEADAFAGLASDAAVGGGGPSVTYTLPRLVTVESDARRRQRTRIANIPVDASFIHVAVPVLTDAVYIRGDLINQSDYQLLAGTASIFIGQDYVGPTPLEPVAPGAPFELYFGIDQSVAVSRLLVSKETSKTGLLGGGRRTSYEYRIEIANDTGKTLALELWDRHPVSQTDRIQIELTDLSTPLATDRAYIEEDQPRGLLKWQLAVPASSGSANPFIVSFGVRVNHSKDVRISPLPD